MAISRSAAATISDAYQGLVVIRPYVQAEASYKNVAISTSKILDISFANPNSNMFAVLSEDQTITIWRITDKLLEKTYERSKIDGARLTHIRWNPFNIDEVFCFSESQLFIMRNAAPTSEVLLPSPVPEGIADIFFIPKATKGMSLFFEVQGQTMCHK